MSIWYGTGDANDMPKLSESETKLGKRLPQLALNDWLENKKKWLEGISESRIS